jgi:hypothetical protein
MPEKYRCIDIDERRVIPDIEIREAVIKACGLRSISDFQLLTLERRKSVIQEVMRSLDVRPRQLSRVTGMNYETIRNIAKNCHENRHPYPGACPHDCNEPLPHRVRPSVSTRCIIFERKYNKYSSKSLEFSSFFSIFAL